MNTRYNVECDHFIVRTLEKMGGRRWHTFVSMFHDHRCGATCCHHLSKMTVCSLNWELKYTISPFGCCVKTFYHRKRKRNHFENVDKFFPCKMEILHDWLYWQGKIQKSHVVVLHKQSSFSCHSFGVNYILIFSQILFPGNKRYITHSSFFPLFIPNFYWKVLTKFKLKLGFKPEF